MFNLVRTPFLEVSMAALLNVAQKKTFCLLVGVLSLGFMVSSFVFGHMANAILAATIVGLAIVYYRRLARGIPAEFQDVTAEGALLVAAILNAAVNDELLGVGYALFTGILLAIPAIVLSWYVQRFFSERKERRRAR